MFCGSSEDREIGEVETLIGAGLLVMREARWVWCS